MGNASLRAAGQHLPWNILLGGIAKMIARADVAASEFPYPLSSKNKLLILSSKNINSHTQIQRAIRPSGATLTQLLILLLIGFSQTKPASVGKTLEQFMRLIGRSPAPDLTFHGMLKRVF